MNKKIKRILAREGLILLGILAIGLLFVFVFSNIPNKDGVVWDTFHDKMLVVGFAILYLAYPTYLLIRFIIWAIRTLRQKD